MIKPKSAQQLMRDNVIVKHYAGSHSYGTSTPTSDVDFRGIFVADPINVRTPFYKIEESTDTTEEDTKLYELSNFMKLALDCNPNVIESLWIDMEDVTVCTLAYTHLRSYREQLLSRKVVFTFSGYAISQLKRLKQSKKKVNDLPGLNKLCEILQEQLVAGNVDEQFIKTQCGEKVLQYMKDNNFINTITQVK